MHADGRGEYVVMVSPLGTITYLPYLCHVVAYFAIYFLRNLRNGFYDSRAPNADKDNTEMLQIRRSGVGGNLNQAIAYPFLLEPPSDLPYQQGA